MLSGCELIDKENIREDAYTGSASVGNVIPNMYLKHKIKMQ